MFPMAWVLVGIEGGSGLLDSGLLHHPRVVSGVGDGAVDGQHSGLLGSVVVEGTLEAMSISVRLLSLCSQMNTVTAIFLDLLSATFLLGSFFVFTSIFLDSACVFWVVVSWI